MSRAALRTLILSSGLLAAGCGIAEYEERMAYTRDRLAYLERINNELGPPLAWPETLPLPRGSRQPEIIQPSELFLRPTKGINSAKPAENKPGPGNTVLWTYRAAPNSEVEEMYLLASGTKGLELLKKEVPPMLGAPANSRFAQRDVNFGPGRGMQPIDVLTWESGRNKVYLFFLQKDGPATVVGYRIAPGKEASVLSRMDLSLSSLANGFQANRLHNAILGGG